MYDQELKHKILYLLRIMSVKEVSEQFNISSSTLYRWQKIKEDSKLIKKLISGERYDEALVIAKNYLNDAPIQSQLMTIYMEKGEYEKAEVIARKFSDYAPIQSQLMTIYMEKGEYEKTEVIARKFSNDAPIQSQLMTIYMRKSEYEKAKEIAQKFPDNVAIQSQLMTIYMRKGDDEKAKKIAQEFSDNVAIQSQLMTIYMRKGDDEKAEVIAQNFSDYAPIQSQLMTIYMRKGEYEKAKEIAQEFQDNVAIQSQLMTIYMRKGEYEKAKEIAQKFPNNNVIQNQLTTNYMKVEENEKIIKNAEEISSLYKMIIQTENQEFPKKIFEIRSKISMGTISVRDLDTLESFKEQLDLEKYLLIRLAIYEKLGLLNVGRNLLRQDKILDDKVKKELIGYFERKSRFYNLEKWDILIGWFNELEEFEEKSPKEYLVDSERISKDLSTQKCPVTSNVQNSNNDFWKVKNNVVDISKKTKKTIKVTSSKIGEQKKKKVIKNKNKTLNDMLNQSYKEMILNLKIKYYKEMYDEEKRKSAIYKYDRLEDVLSSEPSIKNFDLLLLMLIGDGDDCLNIEQSIPKQYSGEYKKVLNRIKSKRQY